METVWLSQQQMADLFGKSRSTVAEQIRNVFDEWELEEAVVFQDFRKTTPHCAIGRFEKS